MIQCGIEHSVEWICSSLLFSRLHISARLLPHCYDCWGTESLLFLLHFTQHHKTYQSQRVIERNVKSLVSLFCWIPTAIFYRVRDSKLGMVHLIQPRGRAGGEVWISRTATRREVWGGTTCHGPQSLSHAACPPLRHQTVHVEAQVVEERSVARQRCNGRWWLREAIGACCSDVMVGLSCCIDREPTIQHTGVGHVPDAPVEPIGVAEVWQDLVICGEDTVN